MIAELLEAFGNRLHPRIVVSFQLWLFPSCFGTTYLSPSVNPLACLCQKGYKRPPGVCLSSMSAYCHWPPQDWTRLPNCSGEKRSFGNFFTYQCTSWNSSNRLHQWTQYGQCQLSIMQVPQVVLSVRSRQRHYSNQLQRKQDLASWDKIIFPDSVGPM